ncbi:hypothetical protein EU805_05455 [Salipiger sp. IMCC34102]|uniref:5' nucleotidase, NT5C type n=1 Tax=Salipiger sp. IMCC34102 TaxID=2510647 RepID=UPI00101D8759|nr:hypothetical protein [Salipiger sp. IMCC34102]RYH03176.1 hypothetical protein EU805_05455 [Salipiger sp. IMCC34102]
MRIAIDMDEVLADAHAGQRRLYRDLGFDPTDEDLRGCELRDKAPAEMAAEVERRLHTGLFFADLDPVPGAQDALRRLRAEHDVFVASAAMEYPASCVHKVAWMERHFPDFPISNLVFCGDKSILRADVLIDDHAHHFEGFAGKGLLFSALHNHGHDWPDRLAHWDDCDVRLGEISA